MASTMNACVIFEHDLLVKSFLSDNHEKFSNLYLYFYILMSFPRVFLHFDIRLDTITFCQYLWKVYFCLQQIKHLTTRNIKGCWFYCNAESVWSFCSIRYFYSTINILLEFLMNVNTTSFLIAIQNGTFYMFVYKKCRFNVHHNNTAML